MERYFPTLAIEAAGTPQPFKQSAKPLLLERLPFATPDPYTASDDSQLCGDTFLRQHVFNDALMVIQHGECVHESYRNGMQANDRHVIHSCTKPLCAMVAAVAIDEGKINPQTALPTNLCQVRRLARGKRATGTGQRHGYLNNTATTENSTMMFSSTRALAHP